MYTLAGFPPSGKGQRSKAKKPIVMSPMISRVSSKPLADHMTLPSLRIVIQKPAREKSTL
jgi:hypothetical protein